MYSGLGGIPGSLPQSGDSDLNVEEEDFADDDDDHGDGG